ncbi:MAG: hypothetical protein IJL83_06780 [Clostridia bacterium]|nr:hypothetical protein [Clostridia bacterium]MBQ6553298.1 hypothetical protein [Clostridia bacterium]MBR5163031.1 hypothetical protein [Schwartzia sp. (in: firmicutes)]
MEEDIDELFDDSGLGDVDFSEMLLALLAAEEQDFTDPEPDYDYEGGEDE